MATTDARTSVGSDPGTGLVYDGFISYSHAADDLLAPRLQSGLQRFAKPWWKRRALRIFRDEASLSANPHLWSSITEALDDSGWFVLLLSPDAAESDWVNREVEYWLEHKDPDRIIPVVTAGEFTWVDRNIVSNAAPPALRGAFPDEPRWVDLRFARSEEQLDLKNPRFSAAVADVASAIRGVPKDELESEEVRQHRRTVRTAWAAGIVVLLFAMFSAAAALFAVDQRNEAEAAAEAEAEQRAEADVQRQLAEEQADRATLFARQVLENAAQLEGSAASPPGSDFDRADDRNIPLPVRDAAPVSPRLDFIRDFCAEPNPPVTCLRDAEFVRVQEPNATNLWIAYEPFHIRHGFVNDSDTPHGSSFPPDFDVEIFVTRTEGPELEDGDFEIGQTYRFTSDYLVREIADECGPGYQTQTRPEPCDRFVHDFPNGLPPGRYLFWVEWRAPCSEWIIANVCDNPDTLLSLFAASANVPFFHDDFTPQADDFGPSLDVWPFDPWGIFLRDV